MRKVEFPTLTYIAGFETWRALGRSVERDSTVMPSWLPCERHSRWLVMPRAMCGRCAEGSVRPRRERRSFEASASPPSLMPARRRERASRNRLDPPARRRGSAGAGCSRQRVDRVEGNRGRHPSTMPAICKVPTVKPTGRARGCSSGPTWTARPWSRPPIHEVVVGHEVPGISPAAQVQATMTPTVLTHARRHSVRHAQRRPIQRRGGDPPKRPGPVVQALSDLGYSERAACRVVGVNRAFAPEFSKKGWPSLAASC